MTRLRLIATLLAVLVASLATTSAARASTVTTAITSAGLAYDTQLLAATSVPGRVPEPWVNARQTGHHPATDDHVGGISDASTTPLARFIATNNGGREYSERELKEAENELRRNKDFRNWFHRNYKADVVKSAGDRTNPNLDRDQVRDAYEEWIDCGRPRSK